MMRWLSCCQEVGGGRERDVVHHVDLGSAHLCYDNVTQALGGEASPLDKSGRSASSSGTAI